MIRLQHASVDNYTGTSSITSSDDAFFLFFVFFLSVNSSSSRIQRGVNVEKNLPNVRIVFTRKIVIGKTCSILNVYSNSRIERKDRADVRHILLLLYIYIHIFYNNNIPEHLLFDVIIGKLDKSSKNTERQTNLQLNTVVGTHFYEFGYLDVISYYAPTVVETNCNFFFISKNYLRNCLENNG